MRVVSCVIAVATALTASVACSSGNSSTPSSGTDSGSDSGAAAAEASTDGPITDSGAAEAAPLSADCQRLYNCCVGPAAQPASFCAGLVTQGCDTWLQSYALAGIQCPSSDEWDEVLSSLGCPAIRPDSAIIGQSRADRLERALVPLLQPIVDECVSCVHGALDLPGHVPPPCPSLRRPCRLRSSHRSGRAASTTSPSMSR